VLPFPSRTHANGGSAHRPFACWQCVTAAFSLHPALRHNMAVFGPHVSLLLRPGESFPESGETALKDGPSTSERFAAPPLPRLDGGQCQRNWVRGRVGHGLDASVGDSVTLALRKQGAGLTAQGIDWVFGVEAGSFWNFAARYWWPDIGEAR
jgi:hypothetical protein